MTDGGDGTKAGLALALALNQGGGEQLGLLDDDADQAVEAVRGGPGRPRGSRNRKTAELAELLKRRHGRGPLELLIERAMADTKALAKELGVDPWDVWKEQNRLAEAAVPYFEQKMPIDIDARSTREVIVQLVAPPGVRAPRGAGLVLEGTSENSEENQEVSDAPDGELNEGELNE